MRPYLTSLGLVLAVLLAPPAQTQAQAAGTEGQAIANPIMPSPSPQLLQPTRSRFSIGGFLGYVDGLSFQTFGLAQDFAHGFPLKARFRMARTSLEPGSAPDARKVFINDATNGTPKEAGSSWDFGLDGLYPVGERTHFFGGVRYTKFKANFKYVGGNEDFDVTSSHWGLAAGMEAEYPMSEKLSLLLAGGAEYFFDARLTGHDTSYSPDGDHVNPRKDYTYSDADDAVEQPVLRPIALVGFNYRLGR